MKFSVRKFSILSLLLVIILLLQIFIVKFSQSPKDFSLEFTTLSPSSFESSSYECTGSCFCQNEKRRSTTTLLSRGLKTLLVATTTLSVLKLAENEFTQECHLQFSESDCPSDSLVSKVDSCSPTDDSEELIESDSSEFSLRPIGIIHVHPTKLSGAVGRINPPLTLPTSTIEIFDEYAEGLQDLEGFSHIYVIWILHGHFSEEMKSSTLKVHPWGFKNHRKRGVFSTRSSRRPNSVAMTLVEIEKVEGNLIHVKSGIDAKEGSPVIDIKPYTVFLDQPENMGDVRSGWMEEVGPPKLKRNKDGEVKI